MTVMNVALPLLSSCVSFIFAALVIDQWRQRRRSFQFAWGLGLIWYGISSGTEFLGSAFGWNEALYRVWYLVGALFVAAYLGAGTVYLLTRSRFGYVAAMAVLLGGLLALAVSTRYPGSQPTALVVFGTSLVGAIAIVITSSVRRGLTGHVAMALLLAASLVVTVVVLTAPVGAPGYATDPRTHVPVGSAFPGYVRVLSGPFNVAGALCLVFGAVFSAYVYMPKRKLLRSRALPPVAAQAYGVLAVAVNLVASLPRATTALFAGQLNSRVPATVLIALGGFIPGVTSGLNRFGVTWSFFLGELLGVLLIFAGFLVSEEVLHYVRFPHLRHTAEAAP